MDFVERVKLPHLHHKSEKLWETDWQKFHNAESVSDKLHFLLRYAVLAPSSHNTQPWIFKLAAQKVELYADRTRCCPVVDPQDRELTISCGAALGMLEVAMKHFGYRGEVTLFPDAEENDFFATVGLGERYERVEKDVSLFHAIVQRRTNRRKFEERSVPQSVLDECVAAAKEFGVQFEVKSGNHGDRSRIAKLVADGDHKQFSNESFRRELASWVHSLRSSTHDGMAPYSMGAPRILDPTAPLAAMVIRRFDIGDGKAAADKDIASHAPAHGLLTSSGETPKDWLNTGRALAKILLILTANGATASYLNQPIEVGDLRVMLQKIWGAEGNPQILLRMGYGPKIEPSARRPLSEVVRYI